jgi:hypothetical protein
VTAVNSNKLWMTAQAPSNFRMPISGHVFGVTTCATRVDVQGTTVSTLIERDRIAVKGAVKGDMGLAQSYFPGTSAWRPPNC